MINIHHYTSFLVQMCWPIYKYFSFRSCLRQCKWCQVRRQLCHLRQDPNQRKVQNRCWASCKFGYLRRQTLPIANVAKCCSLQQKHPKAKIENIIWVRRDILKIKIERPEKKTGKLKHRQRSQRPKDKQTYKKKNWQTCKNQLYR